MLEYVVRRILWTEEKVMEHGQTDMELLEEEMEGRRDETDTGKFG